VDTLGWEGLAGLEHNRGEKAALPSSAADVRLLRDCSTTGRDSSSRGKCNNEPTEEAALRDRIEKLERLVGRLTLENEFLKRGLQSSLSQSQRNGKSSPASNTSSNISGGGAD